MLGVPPRRPKLPRGDVRHKEFKAARAWNRSPELNRVNNHPMPSARVCPWAIVVSDAVDYVDHSKNRTHIEFIRIGDCITGEQVKSRGIELLPRVEQ